MDYLQRLIHRAIAVPREQAQAVFDPFEQVAAWALDVTPPVRAAPLVPPGDAPPPGVGPLDVPAITPVQPAAVAAMPSLREANAMEPAAPPSSATVQSVTSPGAVIPAHTDAPRALAPERDPLRQADAFMNALGVKTLRPDPPPPPQAAATHIDARADRREPPPRSQPVQVAPAAPVLVRPTPPRAPVVIEAAPAAPRSPPRTPAPPNPNSAAPAARRTTPATVQERIVQTTIVMSASSSHRLDELAHSSGIARFGIGQS
jgi:hypothetical protein